MRFSVLVAAFLCLALPARAQTASPDDTARFLAGMPVPAASSLAPLAGEGSWQRHARVFDAAFGRVEANQLAKVRAWSSATITLRKPVLYYFFSGPDFLYATSFFPDATTYVLCGLEQPGAVPDLSKMPRGAVPGALGGLRGSLDSILGRSFFKTRDMREELQATSLTGTLPVLYVFLARSGKTIKDVGLVQLTETGEIVPEGKPSRPNGAGAKITFASPGGPDQTLYYFSVNLANGGFEKSGLKPFADGLGEGNALIKSASYLLHENGFSQVRGFLMQHSASILQDDTGVPLAAFDKTWRFQPFGRYLAPVAVFPGKYQPKMAELFRLGPHAPLGFGIGYRWRANESNLLLATKQETSPSAPPVAAAGKARADAEGPRGLRLGRQP